MLNVAVLVGGPSPEAGISLNSARSVADHLGSADVRLPVVVYFDKRSRPYRISPALLYSNTPEDFDFKLSHSAEPLSRDDLGRLLASCDIAFPVMHGQMGEDGGVQELLEGFGLPYVGSGPAACAQAYDKYSAYLLLQAAGLGTVPTLLVTEASRSPQGAARFQQWLAGEAAGWAGPEGNFVLKPARGGSSIGVRVIDGAGAAALYGGGGELGRGPQGHAADVGPMVLQPYVHGQEFTVVVLEGPAGPVALPPVEVDRRSEQGHGILSYQDKYLASDDVRYYCPPRLSVADSVVASLRASAEAAFRALGLRDFARIDCWAMDDGRALVSDVNPISGMEQNSYLFIQASQVGLSHRQALRFVLSAACRRAGLAEPGPAPSLSAPGGPGGDEGSRLEVAVLFGGATAERQVSVLSGSNVWLKLAGSDRFAPSPYLLSPGQEEPVRVWELTYPVALRHSAEAIEEACRLAPELEQRRSALAQDAAARLAMDNAYRGLDVAPPRSMSLEDFLTERPFVFIALHGGQGEDGTLQRALEERGVAYNGSGPAASALCIDKYRTSLRLAALEASGVHTARKAQVEVAGTDRQGLWARVVEECGTGKVIVKPLADGCSAGVVPLEAESELLAYLGAIDAGQPKLRLEGSGLEVAMPPGKTTHLLFEEYFETDDLAIVAGEDGSSSRLAWSDRTGWVEVTVGVLGTKGAMHALSPSVTVAQKGVLSLQEKFMGGTGVNITPPPAPPLGRAQPAAVARARQLVEAVAHQLGIEGYGRIDAFMHRESGDIVVIEANTLPGLTPSTVLYHQALAEAPAMFPRQLLESVIELGLARRRQPGRRA